LRDKLNLLCVRDYIHTTEPENEELDDSLLIDPPPVDMLVDVVELMLRLSPLAPESWTGVAAAESAVLYAPVPSLATVDAGLKIFEETTNVTSPDRLLPSAM